MGSDMVAHLPLRTAVLAVLRYTRAFRAGRAMRIGSSTLTCRLGNGALLYPHIACIHPLIYDRRSLPRSTIYIVAVDLTYPAKTLVRTDRAHHIHQPLFPP